MDYPTCDTTQCIDSKQDLTALERSPLDENEAHVTPITPQHTSFVGGNAACQHRGWDVVDHYQVDDCDQEDLPKSDRAVHGTTTNSGSPGSFPVVADQYQWPHTHGGGSDLAPHSNDIIQPESDPEVVQLCYSTGDHWETHCSSHLDRLTAIHQVDIGSYLTFNTPGEDVLNAFGSSHLDPPQADHLLNVEDSHAPICSPSIDDLNSQLHRRYPHLYLMVNGLLHMYKHGVCPQNLHRHGTDNITVKDFTLFRPYGLVAGVRWMYSVLCCCQAERTGQFYDKLCEDLSLARLLGFNPSTTRCRPNQNQCHHPEEYPMDPEQLLVERLSKKVPCFAYYYTPSTSTPSTCTIRYVTLVQRKRNLASKSRQLQPLNPTVTTSSTSPPPSSSQSPAPSLSQLSSPSPSPSSSQLQSLSLSPSPSPSPFPSPLAAPAPSPSSQVPMHSVTSTYRVDNLDPLLDLPSVWCVMREEMGTGTTTASGPASSPVPHRKHLGYFQEESEVEIAMRISSPLPFASPSNAL